MKFKNLINKLEYGDYEKLSDFKLIEIAKEKNLYSNLNFIEYFKNRGPIFWKEVIINTILPIDMLFQKYLNYQINKHYTYEMVRQELDLPYWDKQYTNFKNINMQSIKNMKQFLKLFKNKDQNI